MGEKMKTKRYEELNLTDDFMFCKVLQNDSELCRELTELILDRKIGNLVTTDAQKSVEITFDGRGVRFDVYMEDDESTVYDIEMQAYKEKDLPKRTRYYQGMIDLNMIERGSKFRELKRSYIVFICLDNPFPECGRHKYSIQHKCVEVPELKYEDDAHTIILSAEGNKEDVSGEMKDFLKYLTTGETDSELTRKLEARVHDARGNEKWRMEYMTLQERDERMREEGRKEGIKEGALRILSDFVRSGDLSVEQASQKMDMSVDEFKTAVENLALQKS